MDLIVKDVLYLEDRHPPLDESWTWVKTLAAFQERMLASDGPPQDVSLDNDLGMFDQATGVDAVRWMQQSGVWPTRSLQLHTGSGPARREMTELLLTSDLFDPTPEDHPLGPRFLRRDAA